MADIPCLMVENSIPTATMPLNKNFISLDDRVKSFVDYKGGVCSKQMAEIGLFKVTVREKEYVICYNCGCSVLLNEDQTFLKGFICHSRLCTYLPANLLSFKDVELLDDNKRLVNLPEASKLQFDKKEENISNKDFMLTEKANCQNVEEEGLVEEKRVNNSNYMNENSETASNEDSSDEESFGIFWCCKVCGEDTNCKVKNVPCMHQTFCAPCSGKFNKCLFCQKEVLCFWPFFMGYDEEL